MPEYSYRTAIATASEGASTVTFTITANPVAAGAEGAVEVFWNGVKVNQTYVSVAALRTSVTVTYPAAPDPANQTFSATDLLECRYPVSVLVVATPGAGVAGRRNDDYEALLLELYTMVDATGTPMLTDGEMRALLTATCVATKWAVGTVYVYGDRVAATYATPYLYTPCQNSDGTFGGTSGTTEPRWPTTYRWPGNPVDSFALGGLGSIATDGTIIWKVHGPAPSYLWDTQHAASDAWLMKAGKAAQRMQTSGDRGVTFMSQQIFDHCMLMAGRYEPGFIA